jgi:hypothetical protein
MQMANPAGNMPDPAEEIDEMIAQTPDWRGATLARLRDIIRQADPEMTEAVKWRRPSSPQGVPVWEHDGIVCVGNILKKSVRLTFFAGPGLPDPHELFNARLDSGSVRAVDVFEGDRIDEAALKAIIRAGVQHNRSKLKPARR